MLRVPTEMLAPGMVLDDFVLDGVISRGDAIITLRAHQLSMDRPVALRVLRPEQSQDEVQLGRFLQEARGSAALTHPNLLRLDRALRVVVAIFHGGFHSRLFF